MAENIPGLVLLVISQTYILTIRKSVLKKRVYCVHVTNRYHSKLIKPPSNKSRPQLVAALQQG